MAKNVDKIETVQDKHHPLMRRKDAKVQQTQQKKVYSRTAIFREAQAIGVATFDLPRLVFGRVQGAH